VAKKQPPSQAAKTRKVAITSLVLDANNANTGTEKGRQLLEQSLKKYGTGRSILVDKHGRVIAGNKTLQEAKAMGLESVVVIEADADTLIAVQRSDLDLQTDSRAQGLAIADNRVGEINLNWDFDILRQSVDPFGFDASELEQSLASSDVREIEPRPAPTTAWILIGVPIAKIDEARAALDELHRLSNVYVQESRK
jgi:ParB-like chromosome segregation protein Spo0J